MKTDPFDAHLKILQARWEQALGGRRFDSALILAGQNRPYFLDDQSPPFRANPHFLQWFPDDACEGSALLIRPGERPCLFFLKPDDYWHKPPELPAWANGRFDVAEFPDGASLESAAVQKASARGGRFACITEQTLANLPQDQLNPEGLLNHLHYLRAVKTDFEIERMREATRSAVAGHSAARALFEADDSASEFDLNMAYLTAAATTAAELPYSSIVALNEHAGVLHYQHYERRAPAESHSFLIDAGARSAGYASDITRTYAARPGIFADLIKLLDTGQQALVSSIRPGVGFLDLHIDMHRRLAWVLETAGILRCSAEAAFDKGITETFFPHGLGHLIGLQTHDVAGQQSGPEGGQRPPPGNYPSLRLTRSLEPGTVVTIEPGLYFIPQLLNALKTSPHAADVDWGKIDELRPCGGIRIEDNVLVGATGVENLTRAAFDGLTT